MRYFAKYLPVEGEIGIGDYAINSAGSIYQCYAANENTKQDKKVRLFLCSRDIKIGDTNVHTGLLVHSEEEIVREVKDDSQLRFMQGTAEVNKVALFKVLGPISPYATWIKEGDDILSKNIHRGVCKMGHNRWMVIDAEDDVKEWDEAPDIDIAGWAKCYLIEGPCGHMH